MLSQRNYSSSVLLFLIVLYWVTRLIRLDLFALFLDEANHLWWARDVWRLHPFEATIDGRWLNVIWIATFFPFNATVWIARASVVLVTTAGFACMLATTRHYFSLWAATIAGLLYIFMPLTFFFERLALADSISAPFVAATIWIVSVQLPKVISGREQFSWSLMGGVMLTAAILSKISNLIFLCIPLLAAIFLFRWRDWHKNLVLMSVMYFGCALTLMPIVIVLKFLTKSSLGLNLVMMKTGVSLNELPLQILATGQGVLSFLSIYLPFPMWVVILIGIGMAIWRGGRTTWFNISTLAITMGVLIIQTRPAFLASRFLPVYTPMITILVGGGLATITILRRRVLLIVITSIMLINGVIFAWQGWTEPSQLALGIDHWDYVSGWPSGYALREVAFDFVKRDEKLQLTTLDLGSSQKLEGYLLGRTNKVTTRWYKNDFPLDGEWLVIDMPAQESEMELLNVKAIEVARYYRPGKKSWVSVYHVAP